MSNPTPPLGPTMPGSQNLNSLQVNDRTRIHGILELDTDGIINNNVPILEGTAYPSEYGSAGSTIYPKQSPPIGQSAGNIMRSYQHCKPEFYKQTKEDLDGIAAGPGTVGMPGYNRMWGTFHVYQYCPRDQDPNVLPAGTAVQLINPDPASAATFYEEVEVYKWATTDGVAEPVRLPIGITQNEVKADDLVNVCVEGVTTCRWFVTGSVNPPPNGLPTTLRTAKRGIPVYTVGLRGETLSGQVLCGPKATHFLPTPAALGETAAEIPVLGYSMDGTDAGTGAAGDVAGQDVDQELPLLVYVNPHFVVLGGSVGRTYTTPGDAQDYPCDYGTYDQGTYTSGWNQSAGGYTT